MGKQIKQTLDLEPNWKDVMETYIRWISGETTLVAGDRDEALELMVNHFRMLADVASNLRRAQKDGEDLPVPFPLTNLMPSPKLYTMAWAPTDALP
tara:strand:+ start:2041 stop:2328 length:288 start_codon:yes stop_codon:yes gene_type:complete